MAKRTKAVKMADIAQALEVSTVTVSKALSDQSGVSEELRAKIKQLAEEMGYKPLSAIKQGKTRSYNIGVLIPERYLDFYESFYWKLYQEVTNCAMQRGCFTLLEPISRETEQNGQLPKLVTEGKVEGVIVIGRPGNSYADILKKNLKLPLVFLDFYAADVNMDAVISDGFYGTYLLTNYLFDHGHKDIAFVGTLLSTESITDRYLGYCKSLLEHGVKPREDRLISDRDVNSGISTVPEQYELPENLPTAFVCNCDNTAATIVKLVRDKGLDVPKDISVVGFDNYLAPGTLDVELTTYEVDVREMSRISVSTIIKKMSGEAYKKGLKIVEGRLLEKNSVNYKD